MKTQTIGILSVCAALLVLLPGCNKSEQSSSSPPVEVKKSADGAAPAPADVKVDTAHASQAVQAAADNTAAAAQAAATNVQAAAQQATADAQGQADQVTAKNQSLLDSAKQSLADNKPADAIKALNDLVVAKLTPAQKTALENLKQQAQAMLQKLGASDAAQKAADAVGGLLKKP